MRKHPKLSIDAHTAVCSPVRSILCVQSCTDETFVLSLPQWSVISLSESVVIASSVRCGAVSGHVPGALGLDCRSSHRSARCVGKGFLTSETTQLQMECMHAFMSPGTLHSLRFTSGPPLSLRNRSAYTSMAQNPSHSQRNIFFRGLLHNRLLHHQPLQRSSSMTQLLKD